MNMKSIPAWSVLVILAILPGAGCKKKNLEQLLERRYYEAAIKLCEKKEGEEKRKCNKTIAAYYLHDDLYENAAFYYDKAGEHLEAINCYYLGNFIAEAETYCAKQTGNTKIKCAAHLARKFYFNRKPDKAVFYYQMAGDDRMTKWVRGRTPVFTLMETIEKKRETEKNPETRTQMKKIAGTLSSYIYMGKYAKWPYGEKTEPDQRAAKICEKAVRLLEETAAPAFFDILKNTLPDPQWPGKNTPVFSFHHARLDSLIKLVQYVHNIAGYRRFFTTIDSQETKKKKQTDYEAVYTVALTRADGLFETIAVARGVTDEKRLTVYEEDLSIDLDIIEYVSAIMDNLEIRTGDIKTRGKQYHKRLKTEAAKEKSEKLSREFAVLTGRVLGTVGKEEFQEANDMLTVGYETIKTQLTVKVKKTKTKKDN